MPLKIADQTYPLPGESGQPFATGAELIAIEEHFGLDALRLLAAASKDSEPQNGYTRTKSLYAITWLAVHRVDPSLTLEQHLTRPLDALDIVDEENPTNAASSAAESAVA